ncbi:hypothetical protein IWX90DRAFT_321285 [Phyllosticta citrichinensis]|uniref:Uncharacterized protein n=1 Tax=Phyllosticta citrichinensis TaxID=1130410 RepID=A0ABR1XJQ6_9PEZI
MSFSPPSSPMAFTFGTHQSTSPFVFCREIKASSTLSRKRALADPSPSGPSRKKRRLRLSLTKSPLSLPFSTPRGLSQPDRASNHHRRTAISTFRPSQRLPRPPTSASSSSLSSSCSLLRKAAIFNRVQQRMDAACQRNPNLRWEKEQRHERELLLKEGVQMRRMAALRDGLLSPVTSTRPVASPVGDVVHYPDPRRRLAATSHDVDDCERRCDVERESAGGPYAATAATSIWVCSKNGCPTPPPSAVGLSNYDALDSEEEEKDDAAAPLPSMPQQHGDAAAPVSEPAGVVDEGMRDIFDFLTPPAMHRSFLSDFDDGEGENDDAVPGPASVSGSVHPDDANDADNDTNAVDETAGNADREELVHVDAQGRLAQHHMRAVLLKPGPHCTFQRCQSVPLVSCHHQHHMQHYHHHHHHHHHHHRHHDRQHHCAMAAAAPFVAVPRAY